MGYADAFTQGSEVMMELLRQQFNDDAQAVTDEENILLEFFIYEEDLV